jgi:hypothetical protein
MIKIFHFNTGLTIIADENEQGEWEYPMIFQEQVDPNGRVSVMFRLLFMFSEETKKAPEKEGLGTLLFITKADKKMLEKYSGIVTQKKSAESGLIIPGGPGFPTGMIPKKPPSTH